MGIKELKIKVGPGRYSQVEDFKSKQEDLTKFRNSVEI